MRRLKGASLGGEVAAAAGRMRVSLEQGEAGHRVSGSQQESFHSAKTTAMDGGFGISQGLKPLLIEGALRKDRVSRTPPGPPLQQPGRSRVTCQLTSWEEQA